MNCKPGDLAYITHPSMLGKLVTVLHAAPVGATFFLPDGTPNFGSDGPGFWVIQSMGAPFDVQRHRLGASRNIYAVCADAWLRPIRGDGITDDTPADVEKPVTAEA